MHALYLVFYTGIGRRRRFAFTICKCDSLGIFFLSWHSKFPLKYKVSVNNTFIWILVIIEYITGTIAEGRWFRSGTSISSNNKTDRNGITEILLKVALNTITTKHYRDKTEQGTSSSRRLTFWHGPLKIFRL